MDRLMLELNQAIDHLFLNEPNNISFSKAAFEIYMDPELASSLRTECEQAVECFAKDQGCTLKKTKDGFLFPIQALPLLIEKNAIGVVVAECLKSDFSGREFHFRRTDQALGVIDKTHHAQRSRFIAATPPHIQRVQKADRAAKERRCAVVSIGHAPRNQRDGPAGLRHRNGAGEARRPAADNSNGRRYGRIVHELSMI